MSDPRATNPAAPEWLPAAADEIRRVPCGRWFDAVRVPCVVSIGAFARLGGAVGPVVGDQRAGQHWWLVPSGEAVGWSLPEVDVAATGRTLLVPAANAPATAALWWASPPQGPLTDPPLLRAALNDELAGHRALTRPYRSVECGIGQHPGCRHGTPQSTAHPDVYGVRVEPCACPCHAPADSPAGC
ncbi:hypothetical protein [Streptomyces sp. PT12]|uniref:hypothetical protein n=1 Tax=Streptomyces sp. PT12 TaxID=1510197 RepID=UPI0011BE941C|nr:hypothetical protein [Streptomyces sp. PT12]